MHIQAVTVFVLGLMGIDRYHTLSISMPYFGWMNMHEYQLYPAILV
jgi:hypothetical protein